MKRTAMMLAGILVAASAGLCPSSRGATVTVAGAAAGASDENPGTSARPLKTIAKGLALAKPGDTVLVKAGKYAETIVVDKSGEEGKPLVLRAAPGETVTILGGMNVAQCSHVRVEGFTFAAGEQMKGRRVFVEVRECRDAELAGLEISEKPENPDWYYRGIDIYGCERLTFRDSKIHHVDLGVNLGSDRDCVVRNLEIGPWDHEDGLRMMRCDGIVVEGCHIQSEEMYRPGNTHPRSGHIDGIQIIRKNDNITVRNCHIHGTAQGIGVFTDSFGQVEGWNEPRKNFRIEGNLILTFNRYQGISMYRVENPVVVNNTLPVSRLEIGTATGDKGVVRNNIAAIGSVSSNITDVDCNIWTEEVKGGTKGGPRDLVKVWPLFVNAPTYDEATDYKRVAEFTEGKVIFPDELDGRIVAGDRIEVNGDRVLRKVTRVEGKEVEFVPPLAARPTAAPRVANWKTGTTSFERDYRLKAGSPAIDSADSGVGRSPDRYGIAAVDVKAVENKGLGDKPYLDRGAFEYVPAAAR